VEDNFGTGYGRRYPTKKTSKTTLQHFNRVDP